MGSLSGIAHHFRLNNLPTDCFTNKTVKAARMSVTLNERSKEEVQLHDKKFPLTGGMLAEMVQHLRLSGSIEDEMVAVAVMIAFFALFRSSEYVPDHVGSEHNCCHALLARDVQFEVTLPNGQVGMYDASEVELWMWEHVTLIKFSLRSAKNDKLRMGHVFWYRNRLGCSGINIVKECFDWEIKARLRPKDFFMSRSASATIKCLWRSKRVRRDTAFNRATSVPTH